MMSGKKEILGSMGENLPKGKERLEDDAKVHEALQKADTATMFAIYEKMVKERSELETTLFTLAGMATEKQSKTQAIKDMKEVALAAIELAKFCAGKGKTS